MKILEGVLKQGSDYTFDYTSDSLDDIVHLTGPSLYKSAVGGNNYYFGYTFNSDVSSAERTEFIRYLKGLGDNQMPANVFLQFADRPLAELDKQIGLSTIDAVVYPVSGINNLVRNLVKVVSNFMQHGVNYASYEVVKNVPSHISFDYGAFAANVGGVDSQSYQDSLPAIERMLDRIHSSEYFSIARDVKSKYRPFMMNYLKLSDENSTDALQSLITAKSILLIDDINTTGSTIRELLRIIRSVNTSADVYVYTLIGKDSTM